MPEEKIESDFILTGDATQEDLKSMIMTLRKEKYSHLNDYAFAMQILEIGGAFPMKLYSIAHLRTASEKAGLKVKIVVYQE